MKNNSKSYKNRLLIFSLLLNAIFLIFLIQYAITHRENIVQKIIDSKHTANIVLFGDSHIARGPWFSMLKRFDVKCSGYGGFTSEQLKYLVKNSVIDYRPEICFIQCGGNDINDKCFSYISVINNYEEIIDSLTLHKITPVAQSLFYRYKNPEYNTIVDSLNLLLVKLTKEKNVDYLNINKDLIDSNGLRKELTVEGIHLNKEGYKIWGEKIKSYLREKSEIDSKSHPD